MFEVINPLTFPSWNDHLLTERKGSFFHTANWARVLAGTYDYRPVYFTAWQNHSLCGLMPLMEIRSLLTGRRGVSLPFSDFCETIVDHPDRFSDLLKDVIDYGIKAGWRSIELMDGSSMPTDALHNVSYYGHTLKLNEDVSEIYSAFSENIKRNIRKALRSGIDIRIESSMDAVGQFYRLHCITRKRHGVPPQPMRFFRAVFDQVLCQNMGLLISARYKDTVVASSMYFHFGDRAIFKYGASDPEYRSLQANSLIMWKAIEWYCKNGYQVLSLGRTDTDNEGLRRYKTGWGPVEGVIKYYKYDLQRGCYVSGKRKVFGCSKQLFRRMPLGLLRLSGSLLYRHIG